MTNPLDEALLRRASEMSGPPPFKAEPVFKTFLAFTQSSTKLSAEQQATISFALGALYRALQKQSPEERLSNAFPTHDLPDEPTAVDTFNRWMVGIRSGEVVLFLLPSPLMSPLEALQLAAWLTVGAELAGHRHALESHALTVDLIRRGERAGAGTDDPPGPSDVPRGPQRGAVPEGPRKGGKA